MNLAINGRFFGAHRTGVQRFAIETARRLLPGSTLFVPAGVEPPDFVPPDVRVVTGRISGHRWEQLELPGRIRRSGCDCVLHMAGTAPIVSAGHVLVVHDLLPLTHGEWFTRAFRLWRAAVLRAAVPRAARVVTVSESVRREIIATFGVPPERVVVADQGAEPFDTPAAADAIADVRARFELPRLFLLAVGAGDPRKNLPFLGRVLARWRERGLHPPPLVVVGAPAPRLFTPEAGWPQGVDVRPLGRVGDRDLHALYTAAAALCFPSLAEGFGRPPLEAIACGTPVVVAPYEAAVELLDGVGYIRPLDPDLWVDALIAITANGRVGAAGRALAERYRWDRAAETIRRVCEEAALEPRGGR
jgi:glycosyltransferase involved in cell wall biosynthesis